MKRGLLLLLLLCLVAGAQTVSYWFQGWQTKPNAEQAAAYFMVPGANVTFTYLTNRVIINSTGGGGGGALQLFGDVTSPLTALPNVTATLATLGGGGVNTKITFNTKGLVTGSSAAVLASADFANQGTLTTLLHGNAGGNPSWSAVDLANDVTGNLGVTHLDSGNNADNSHYWRGDGTWATITGPTILDIRTNAYNLFSGTNSFSNDVYVAWGNGRVFQIGATNARSVAMSPYDFIYTHATAAEDLGPGEYLVGGAKPSWQDNGANSPLGITLRSVNEGGSGENGLYIAGMPVFIGADTTSSGNNQGVVMFHSVIGGVLGGWTEKGNLISGGTIAMNNHRYLSTGGGIYCTNFMHTTNYMRAGLGFVAQSNAWTVVTSPDYFKVPNSSDSFSYGDCWFAPSNGVPTWVWKDVAGTVFTNQFSAAGGLIPAITNGIANLTAGAATVSTTMANSARTIVLTYYSIDSKQAMVGYSNVVNGASFKIYSSNVNDTNKVSWLIVL